MTQDQLANATGMDPSNIRAFESGRGMPNVYTIVRLSQALLLEEPGELLKGLHAELFPQKDL